MWVGWLGTSNQRVSFQLFPGIHNSFARPLWGPFCLVLTNIFKPRTPLPLLLPNNCLSIHFLFDVHLWYICYGSPYHTLPHFSPLIPSHSFSTRPYSRSSIFFHWNPGHRDHGHLEIAYGGHALTFFYLSPSPFLLFSKWYLWVKNQGI